MLLLSFLLLFFFNDTATTEIYTLSLHDALPISVRRGRRGGLHLRRADREDVAGGGEEVALLAGLLLVLLDPKSTRLNSSHANISHAVFCLKKKTSNSSSSSPSTTIC